MGQLDNLSPDLHRRVLAFVQALTQSFPKGVSGKKLLRFSGIMEAEDIRPCIKPLKLNVNEWKRMSGKFLLDTNILIALFGGDTSIQKYLENADEVFISSTVLGELYFGAHKSNHVKQNLAHVDDFASDISVPSCDSNTA